MAQALELPGHDAATGEACPIDGMPPARAKGLLRGAWSALGTWLDRINGTPVMDIGRADYGSIRRLAEA